jgi:septal ring factor EnvC (AmiA/AmiB activator)
MPRCKAEWREVYADRRASALLLLAHHAPERAEQRRRAASKGGSGRVSSEIRQLRERLKTLTDQVIEGDLETARGAVANQLITTQIKLLEYERRTKDLDDLLERLERLERGRLAG